MSESAIRTAIYNAVNGVTDVGNVYNRQRWVADLTDFLALWKATIGGSDVLRGWDITCESMDTERLTFESAGALGDLRTWNYRIRGFLGLDDSASTEITAVALAETVLDALDDDVTLHDQSTYYDCSKAAMEGFSDWIFGEVLVHLIEITISISEEV